MSVMLPALLVVPFVLIVLFELDLLDTLKAQTEPDDAGHISHIGRAILYGRSMGIGRIDRTIGASDGMYDERSRRVRDMRQKTLARIEFSVTKTLVDRAAEHTAHAVERSAEEVVHAAALHVHVELVEKRSDDTMAGAMMADVEPAASLDEHTAAEPTPLSSPEVLAALEMLDSAEAELSELSRRADNRQHRR